MQIMNTEKAAARRKGSKSVRPQRGGLIAVLLAAALFLACAMCVQSAYAKDELRLTAIIKNINPKTGLVYADVQSESCPGMRTFRADDLDALGKYIDRAIDFYIDSSTCSDTATHTILVSRGINK